MIHLKLIQSPEGVFEIKHVNPYTGATSKNKFRVNKLTEDRRTLLDSEHLYIYSEENNDLTLELWNGLSSVNLYEVAIYWGLYSLRDGPSTVFFYYVPIDHCNGPVVPKDQLYTNPKTLPIKCKVEQVIDEIKIC
jgi:hypothetical protein